MEIGNIENGGEERPLQKKEPVNRGGGRNLIAYAIQQKESQTG